jgi:hypothetical protein
MDRPCRSPDGSIGQPTPLKKPAIRRSSARECRQAYATTLLSSVKGQRHRRAE